MSDRQQWDTFGGRLRWARRKDGFDSPDEAADRYGWNRHTYKSHEKGKRTPRDHTRIHTYARAYKVNTSWLITGHGSPASSGKVPLYGIIAAGEEIEPVPLDNPEYVDCPFPIENGAAVDVRGDSMQPVYRPGDRLFFSQRERSDYVALIGRDCIVRLRDGRRFVKTLLRGTKRGLYRLRSYATLRDIEDVEVDWAAPVEWVRRAGD